MRIAVWHNLSSGGAKRVLYDQVRGLIAEGHHTEAWCPPSADQSHLPLSELIREHVVPLRRTSRQSEQLAIREFVADRRDDIAAMDEHCGQCAMQMGALRFDILLAHSCRFYRTTAIGRMTRLPSILVAEPYRPLYEAGPVNAWAAPERMKHWWISGRGLRMAVNDARLIQSRRIQVREEIANARGFDRLLAYSSYARESIRRSYGLDADVCYPGVDADAFRVLDLEREPFVMSIGAICPDKNLHFVVEALARLPEPRPPLVWVGDQVEDDYLNQVADLARMRGIKLHVHRMIDQEALVDLLNRATLMVYAPRLEPLGLAPLEAGACALPVVAAAEAGIRETIVSGKTGLLTTPTADAFAAATYELLSNPSRAAAMGRAARDHIVQNWSTAAATARLTVHLLEVAIGSGG